MNAPTRINSALDVRARQGPAAARAVQLRRVQPGLGGELADEW